MGAALIARAALQLLARLPAWVWVVLALALWGLWGHARTHALLAQQQAQAHQLEVQRQRAAAAEEFRAAEYQAAATDRKIADALQSAQARRNRDAAAADRRLRALAAAWAASMPAAAASAGGRDDAPAVAVLRDETRTDLVGQADDAEADANRLRTLQRYVTEVCRPAQ